MRRIISAALAAGFLWVVPTIGPMGAMAQASDLEKRQFSSRVGIPVSRAAGLLQEEKFSEALAGLSDVLRLDGLTPYERSNIQQMRGSAFYGLDRLGDAIAAFERAIEAGGLNPAESENLISQIAQLKIANGSPAEGAQMLEAWAARGGTVTPRHVEMLVQTWAEAKEYAKALPWAEKWFAAAASKERKHYNMMNFLYNSLAMPEKQTGIVMSMIERWPDDPELWTAWISLLVQSGDDEGAFEVNRMMYLRGLVTREADILKLVQYHGFFDIPYQGAKILENEMADGRVSETADTLKNLSNLWRQAREYEKAIPVLEKAARLDGDKATYAALAEALINRQDCAGAEKAFGAAIELGYGPGKPWMLIGTCRYETAQSHPKPDCSVAKSARDAAARTLTQNDAREAFKQVTSPSSLRLDAQKWMSFIGAEQKALEGRCDFIADLRRKKCEIDIDQAYKNVIFNQGQFILEDETCRSFKADYDKVYRASLAPPQEG